MTAAEERHRHGDGLAEELTRPIGLAPQAIHPRRISEQAGDRRRRRPARLGFGLDRAAEHGQRVFKLAPLGIDSRQPTGVVEPLGRRPSGGTLRRRGRGLQERCRPGVVLEEPADLGTLDQVDGQPRMRRTEQPFIALDHPPQRRIGGLQVARLLGGQRPVEKQPVGLGAGCRRLGIGGPATDERQQPLPQARRHRGAARQHVDVGQQFEGLHDRGRVGRIDQRGQNVDQLHGIAGIAGGQGYPERLPGRVPQRREVRPRRRRSGDGRSLGTDQGDEFRRRVPIAAGLRQVGLPQCCQQRLRMAHPQGLRPDGGSRTVLPGAGVEIERLGPHVCGGDEQVGHGLLLAAFRAFEFGGGIRDDFPRLLLLACPIGPPGGLDRIGTAGRLHVGYRRCSRLDGHLGGLGLPDRRALRGGVDATHLLLRIGHLRGHRAGRGQAGIGFGLVADKPLNPGDFGEIDGVVGRWHRIFDGRRQPDQPFEILLSRGVVAEAVMHLHELREQFFYLRRAGGGSRVVGGQQPFHQRRGVGGPAECEEHQRQLLQGRQRHLVVRPDGLLPDVERPSQRRLGGSVVLDGPLGPRQRQQRRRDVGMAGAERLLLDRNPPLEQRDGIAPLPDRLTGIGQRDVDARHPHAILPELPLPQLDQLDAEFGGLLPPPRPLQERGHLVHQPRKVVLGLVSLPGDATFEKPTHQGSGLGSVFHSRRAAGHSADRGERPHV